VLSAKDNVRSLLAWSVYGTDEIERHADEAERKVLEDLVKQGGLDHLEDTTSSKGGASSMDQSAILPDTATLTDNSPSSLWGNFPSSSPQPDVEGDAKRQRFPHLATEILCADYFQISETLWSDLSGLLGPMWDIVLSSREEGLGMPAMDGYTTVDEKARLRSYVRYEIDKAKVERDDEDEKRREIIRGNWTRVNGMLMIKQPARVSVIRNGAFDGLYS
jgi:SIT4-associating protein SAP185/190